MAESVPARWRRHCVVRTLQLVAGVSTPLLAQGAPNLATFWAAPGGILAQIDQGMDE